MFLYMCLVDFSRHCTIVVWEYRTKSFFKHAIAPVDILLISIMFPNLKSIILNSCLAQLSFLTVIEVSVKNTSLFILGLCQICFFPLFFTQTVVFLLFQAKWSIGSCTKCIQWRVERQPPNSYRALYKSILSLCF